MADRRTDTDDFLKVFHFEVSFPGADWKKTTFPFASVGNLTQEVTVEDVQEGGMNSFTHRLPKPLKYRNLILKRALSGCSASDGLVKWAKDAVNFRFTVQNVLITLLNERHEAVMKWNFAGAYPVRLETSGLDASKNELVIQTLELAYKYYTVE